jgi:hypothetical protein
VTDVVLNSAYANLELGRDFFVSQAARHRDGDPVFRISQYFILKPD